MDTSPDFGVTSWLGLHAEGSRRRACWHWLYEMQPPLAEDTLLCESAGPAQSRLLEALLKPGPQEDLQLIFGDLLRAGDYEAACAAAVAGMSSVFEGGRDFSEFQVWLDLAVSIFDRTSEVSPQGRGALLLQCAVADIVGSGDLVKVAADLSRLALLAEEADCDALRISHAAAYGYYEIMSGRLLVANAVVRDALHLSPQPGSHLVPKIHLQATLGLLNTVRGLVDDARESFDAIVQHPVFEHLPVSIWLVYMGHRLLSLATARVQTEELAICADQIRARSIPDHKHYHRSYLHYALGAAALLTGQAETALFHARTAAELGRFCQSVTAERTSALVVIQALNDLGRHDEALLLLREEVQGWSKAGANLLVSSAAIEEASLLLQRGRVADARDALSRAHGALPPGEDLPHNLRSNHFVAELVARLDAPREPFVRHHTDRYPVQITTFGELRVEINGRILYDRDWHGNRGKTLLKALIVLGGHKVSAERLCDLLWPDAEGDVARNSLKVSLWRLRRLGCRKDETPLPWIAVQHGHVSLVFSLCRVDCIGFEQEVQSAMASGITESIARVLATVTANFLANDDSETWIIQHRENLMRHYLRAVYALAEVALRTPSNIDPMPLLETAIRLAPDDIQCRQLLKRFQLIAK